MSGLPILSPVNTVQMPARDVAGAQTLQPAQATTTAVRTIIAHAVQQATNADPAEKAVPKVLVTQQDKRNRLVGPPPTFEVNLLQHLQETRMDPEIRMPADLDDDHADQPLFPAGSDEDAKPETTTETPVKRHDSAYQSYVKMSDESNAASSPEFDKSV